MTPSKDQLASAKGRMLNDHLRGRGISDPRILAAFEAVPRERFISPDRIGQAYADCPLPIGYEQTISQPYIVAEMIQQLRPQPHHRILDVGAGSGYQAALLARLVAHVYAIERIEALADQARQRLDALGVTNVTIHTGDGSVGWPEEAPFDGIISGAASPDVPPEWLEQLAEDGRIVAPIGPVAVQDLQVVTKTPRGPKSIRICGVRFVKLIGQQGYRA